MKKESEIQQERLKELFGLIKENPDLPIVPMVDSEIVADDGYQWWMGSWGHAEKTKCYRGDECVHFYEPDDWEEIEGVINDAATVDFDFDNQTDEEAKEAYEGMPWTEAIVVYIRLPE